MANKKPTPKKRKKARRITSKLAVWKSHYLNQACKATFLNSAESAKRAGYKASSEEAFRAIGSQNYTKLAKEIGKWLDEHGLSEEKLKEKLLSLLEAGETKFHKIRGAVTTESLPEGVKVISKSGIVLRNDKGIEFSDGETLLAVDVENLGIQAKALRMALDVKGMLAPKKHELSGPGGGPIDSKITIEFVDGDELEKEETD